MPCLYVPIDSIGGSLVMTQSRDRLFHPEETTLRLSNHSSADTIFALSSAPGRAGVAVIRISGPEAIAAAAALGARALRPRRAHLRTLRDPTSARLLDKALVLAFERPESFTGEDVVELHVHGGPAVITAVLEVLQRIRGLRQAEPGEFARRAFENGKLDLTEVEGLADLIAAETEAQHAQALEQMAGQLGALYAGWRERLIRLQAQLAASLDFSDEGDVPEEVGSQISGEVARLARELRAHLDDSHRGEIIREGFRVALAGPTNAGKSSLLNALARRDVAIVSDEPGTTRDVLEARLDLGGLAVVVIDTAGLREAAGAVEREGMRRAAAEIARADLVLWLSDVTAPSAPPPGLVLKPGARCETVATKLDLLNEGIATRAGLARTHQFQTDQGQTDQGQTERRTTDHEAGREGRPPELAISVVSGQGLDDLIAFIAGEAQARTAWGVSDTPVLTRARHRAHLEACFGELERFLAGGHPYPELAAEDLARAARALGRITGHVDVEDILDRLFAEFCIGK